MQRKPIRMTTIVGGDGDELLIVLCDDSTIWSYGERDKDGKLEWEWVRLPDIPHDTPELQQQLSEKLVGKQG